MPGNLGLGELIFIVIVLGVPTLVVLALVWRTDRRRTFLRSGS